MEFECSLLVHSHLLVLMAPELSTHVGKLVVLHLVKVSNTRVIYFGRLCSESQLLHSPTFVSSSESSITVLADHSLVLSRSREVVCRSVCDVSQWSLTH
jgi:hypothetical protein